MDIYTDGSSKNPGDSGIGVVIIHHGKVIKRISKYVGIMTCNVAEYKAIITGLRYAILCNASVINLFSDSELAIRQLLGEYKVNSEGIKPFYKKAKRLMSQFVIINLFHISREANKKADKLAAEGMKNKRR